MNLTSERPNPPSRASSDAAHWNLPTMVEVAQWRASQHGTDPAYTYLIDGAHQTSELTYAELDSRARSIAAALQERGKRGQRVLVVLEPGLDYVATLFGCFYAGAIAVPVYPPDPFRLARTMPRLHAISQNADCNVLVSSGALLGGESSALRQIASGDAFAIEEVTARPASAFKESTNRPNDIAILQYTSGTTGTPRGVAISYENLQYNMRAMEQLLDVPDAVVMLWLPPYHDLGLIGGVLLPLFAGRRVVLMSPLDFVRHPAAWLHAISRYRATTSAAPNFGYELCVRKISDEDCEGVDLSSWQVAVSGAEPVRSETLDRFCKRFGPYGFRREAFVPAYGMAEATLMVSVSQLHLAPKERKYKAQELSQSIVSEVNGRPLPSRRLVGCGPPGPDVEVRIVDPESREPITGIGEIWVRTPGVAAGYWGDQDATGRTFDAVTACGDSGYLRTGDLGFLDRGELFVIGRLKETLILAGRNYYPQDIELAIQSRDPAFKADGGAVAAVEVNCEERLVVFQEVSRPKRQDLDKLLAMARDTVVEETLHEPYAVLLVPVGDLPKTSSGKTRRTACWQEYKSGLITPLRVWSENQTTTETANAQTNTPPSTNTEKWLADSWANVLDVERVCREDNFLALGGQSLQLIEMLQCVARQSGRTMAFKDLLENPTLEQFARLIDASPETKAAAALPTASPEFLKEEQPLSDPQQRFWMLEQLGLPGGANVPLALRVSGGLDHARVQCALNTLAEQNQALRTSFTVTAGEPRQRLEELATIPLEVIDGYAGDDPIAFALDLPLVWRPFDLTRAPLARAALIRIGEDDHVLLLVLHHLICDGGSFAPLIGGLAALCCDTQPERADRDYWDYLGQPSTTYADDKRIAYWRDRLAGLPSTINLPLSNQPPAATPQGVSVLNQQLPADLVQSVESLAALHAVTPFMVYLTAYEMLLSQYSGDQRVAVGVAQAGRDHPAWRSTLGCFMDAAPLASDLAQDISYAEHLATRRQQTLADFENSGVAWDALLAASGVERVAGRMPLAQSFFLYETAPAHNASLGDAQITHAATDYRGLGVYDLTLVVNSDNQGASVQLVHDPARLKPELAQAMAASYQSLLEQITSSPGRTIRDLSAVAPAQAVNLMTLAAGPERESAPQPPLEAFKQHAASRADHVAVACGDAELTYGQLEAASDAVAKGLIAAGVGLGDRVALLTKRSPEMLAAMLGVWKCGAAYVPMDATFPIARLQFMLENCRATAVLVDDDQPLNGLEKQKTLALQALARDAQNSDCELPVIEGNNAAYVIYTSGSTGQPKGVEVGHAALGNFLRSFAGELGLTHDDRVLAATTVSFDISALELFLPLTLGASVVLADSNTVGDGRRLATLINQSRVTLVQGTPSTYRMLLAAGWRPSEQHRVLAGGEELTPDVAQQLLSASRLWNVYGPTETTIWSTVVEVTSADARISIGRPIDNTTCYLLDRHQRLVPPGAWGELAIGGAGLAEEYFGNPELTAARFPTIKLPGDRAERVYLTGDRARWAADGELEFGGRVDSQVKVRGRRIELGEIELALTSHQAIAEAAVATHQDESGASLAAYYVLHPGQPLTPAELRSHLAQSLPEYMLPAAFVEMDGPLPRNGSGKLDRARLPKAEGGRLSRTNDYVAPRTPIEQRLVEWCREVLRIEQVGVTDNFFELGGHSLSLMQLAIRVRDGLGVELPLREAYAKPSIENWAEMVLQSQIDSGETLDQDLLKKLEGLTDEQAIALLESMNDD